MSKYESLNFINLICQFYPCVNLYDHSTPISSPYLNLKIQPRGLNNNSPPISSHFPLLLPFLSLQTSKNKKVG